MAAQTDTDGPHSWRISDDLLPGNTDHSSKVVSSCEGCTKLVVQPGSDKSAAIGSAADDDGHVLCQTCVDDAEPQGTTCTTKTPSSKCLPDAVQVSLRLRYSRDQMLHLQSSFTSEPVGWKIVRDNGEKLACYKDCKCPTATSNPDWPVIMEVSTEPAPSLSVACPAVTCAALQPLKQLGHIRQRSRLCHVCSHRSMPSMYASPSAAAPAALP